MTGAVAGVAAPALLFAAILVWPSRRRRTLRRLVAVVGGEAPRRGRSSRRRRLDARTLAALAGGCGTALFVGLPWGVPLGVVVAVVAHLILRRLEPAAVRRRRARIAADLPITVDLLAACHRSGSSPASAADAVSRAIGGPLGVELQRVVALLRLGGDPIGAWSVLDAEPLLAPLGRAVGRAMSSGAPVAVALTHVAQEARQQRRTEAEESARKVGVRATIPLGLCFLPAFVLLGVVPVAAGIASNVHLW